jgi:hypothetical protein
MYKIHITAAKQEIGAAPFFAVTVLLPGQSSGLIAHIGEHNLRVILNEIVAPDSVDAHLKKAHAPEGDIINLPQLSEPHFNMLRGLPPKAVGR